MIWMLSAWMEGNSATNMSVSGPKQSSQLWPGASKVAAPIKSIFHLIRTIFFAAGIITSTNLTI